MPNTICSIPDCTKNASKRTWCGMHYQRWRSNGDPLVTRQPSRGRARAHFDENLMVVTDDCKIWPYDLTDQGYGRIKIRSSGHDHLLVHVQACIAFHGRMPEPGMYAAHGPCHNPACWNGAHVSWKTPTGNARDKVRDGTHRRGSQIGNSKLTAEDVLLLREMRRRGERLEKIAAELGVHRIHANSVARGKYWQWLPDNVR